MRWIAALSLLAIGCVAGPPAARRTPVAGGAAPVASAGRLEERYDERRDETLVRVVPADAAASPRLIAGATYPGRLLASPPQSALLGFRRVGSAWRHEGCAVLELLADGVKLAEGPALRDTELRGGELVELMTTVVPLATVARLAWASRFELLACGETVSFPREDRELLSRLVKRLTPP